MVGDVLNTLTLQYRTKRGYSCDARHQISDEQWDAINAIIDARTPSPQVELREALEKPAPTQDAAINPSWRAGFYQGYSQAKNDIRAALSPQDEVIGGRE